LISGRGSNLQALIDAERASRLGGKLAVVVSNVENAQGLERARAAGIPAAFRDHKGRPREAFDREVRQILEHHAVDLVCLAGFMRLLSAEFIRGFAGRIVNVHPSLLPSFPGQDAQRQALEYGVRVTGATVHLVDEGLDTGPIVAQEAVAVLETDDLAALQARILEVEHRIYPKAVEALCQRDFRLDGRRLHFGGTH
jgi:phosphoribosylglycinamide formyltransferase-1